MRRVRRLVGLAETLAVELDEFINMVEYPEDCKEVAETHWKATVAYRIQPYAGQITAFDCPPRTQFRGARIRCAWEGVARGRIRWVDVSGMHGTMMHTLFGVIWIGSQASIKGKTLVYGTLDKGVSHRLTRYCIAKRIELNYCWKLELVIV